MRRAYEAQNAARKFECATCEQTRIPIVCRECLSNCSPACAHFNGGYCDECASNLWHRGDPAFLAQMAKHPHWFRVSLTGERLPS